MVMVPFSLQMRCRPRSLPGVRPRPRSRVTLVVIVGPLWKEIGLVVDAFGNRPAGERSANHGGRFDSREGDAPPSPKPGSRRCRRVHPERQHSNRPPTTSIVPSGKASVNLARPTANPSALPHAGDLPNLVEERSLARRVDAPVDRRALVAVAVVARAGGEVTP